MPTGDASPPPADKNCEVGTISLVICTRNRAGSLAGCLEAIVRASQNEPNALREVILVDNGSSDNTIELLQKWQKAQEFDVVVLEEPAPGLARARNFGLSRARGEIIACTDDDCLIAEDYLSSMLSAFSRHSGLFLLGGRIELGDLRDLPITVKLDTEERVLNSKIMPGGFIMGANFALRRIVFDMVGPFDERFGAGAKFRSAEDTDYLVRARKLGISVIYDPEPTVLHFHGRRSVAEAKDLYAGYSFGDGAIFAKHFVRDASIRYHIFNNFYWAFRDLFKTNDQLDLIFHRKNIFKLKWNIRGFISYFNSKLFL